MSDDELRAQLLRALEESPADLGLLTDLGTLLFRTGYRAAARTVYAQAVAHHPDDATAQANLANAHFDAGDLDDARMAYERAIALDPHHAYAHQGLSYVFNRLGDEAAARAHRERGFRDRPVVERPYRGAGIAPQVLAIVSAAGGNIFTDHLLDDRRFGTTTIVADFADPDVALPPHDLVFNTIGDADRAAAALQRALAIAGRTTKRVLNHPALVLATSRVQNAGRFAAIEGVRTARTIVVPRAALSEAAGGFGFPLLLRSPGFHTGEFFVRVERADELEAAAAALPGDALLMMQFIDTRAEGGRYRKYRVMAIGGKLYPLHAALSSDWKVHYFTAEMTDRADHRAEDEAFLRDMSGTIGAPALAALERVAAALGLDYAGIDFGRDASGCVVVFEANATMIVLPPDPDPRWAYRRPAVDCVLEAVDRLLRANGGACSE